MTETYKTNQHLVVYLSKTTIVIKDRDIEEV